MAKRNQHVVPHQSGWAVRREGSARVTSVHRTQADATAAARQIARNQQVELMVHGRDGRIRTRDSHGGDPFPPRG